MVPSILCAPLDRPQIPRPSPVPPTPPPLSLIDKKLLESLRDAGSCPTWSLLNTVANHEGPHDRLAGRLFRLELLDRLKRLRGLGLVFPLGRNWLADARPTPATWRPTIRRRRRTVATTGVVRAVSALAAARLQEAGNGSHQVQFQLQKENPTPRPSAVDAGKTESAPSAAQITQAARSLARLPRRPKRIWSGWIGSTRTYRRMPITLSSGESVFAFGALRGRVVFTYEVGGHIADPDLIGKTWGVVRARDVEILKSDAAVLLGKRKAGTIETKSGAKAHAARFNGLRPCHEGKRRGRPRTAVRLATLSTPATDRLRLP